MEYVRIIIPSNRVFTKQWYQWIYSKVKKKFKRDPDRVMDTVQNVCLRLLAKDFIGRWFYKHLVDELVDKIQAEKILGGAPLTYIGHLNPVHGHRTSNESLWRISDLLKFAKFDYDRYYYSIQNHTISSDDILELLGYKPGRYNALKSLWRQGKLLPAEFTEHKCPRRGQRAIKPKICSECSRGLASFRAKGLSLSSQDDWESSQKAPAVAKIRWNDSQLRDFLRSWKRTNIIQCTPDYIMRRDAKMGVDAGLLRYAEFVISHETVNDFKRMARTDDMSIMTFNNGVSPEHSDNETTAWESDESDETPQRVIRDVNSTISFSEINNRHDLAALAKLANLSPIELQVIECIDFQEMSARDCASILKLAVSRVHRLHLQAISKFRQSFSYDTRVVSIIEKTCRQYQCRLSDIVGSEHFGEIVKARTAIITQLDDLGLDLSQISSFTGIDEDRIAAALNRQVLHDMRTPS